MLKIRRSQDRLIINMSIPILVRRHLYDETAPRWHGKAYRITAPLCVEYKGHRWIPVTKGQWYEIFDIFICCQPSCLVLLVNWQILVRGNTPMSGCLQRPLRRRARARAQRAASSVPFRWSQSPCWEWGPKCWNNIPAETWSGRWQRSPGTYMGYHGDCV